MSMLVESNSSSSKYENLSRRGFVAAGLTGTAVACSMAFPMKAHASLLDGVPTRVQMAAWTYMMGNQVYFVAGLAVDNIARVVRYLLNQFTESFVELMKTVFSEKLWPNATLSSWVVASLNSLTLATVAAVIAAYKDQMLKFGAMSLERAFSFVSTFLLHGLLNKFVDRCIDLYADKDINEILDGNAVTRWTPTGKQVAKNMLALGALGTGVGILASGINLFASKTVVDNSTLPQRKLLELSDQCINADLIVNRVVTAVINMCAGPFSARRTSGDGLLCSLGYTNALGQRVRIFSDTNFGTYHVYNDTLSLSARVTSSAIRSKLW